MNFNLGKRVKYYLIGLGMGLVLTFFIFGNRGCSWLPENRVKSQISEGAIVRSDSMKCVLECNDISDDFINDLVLKGEVLFSESSPRSEPKVYVVEYEGIKLHFEMIEDSVSAIIGTNQDKECACSGSAQRPLMMTNKMIKKFLSNREYEIDTKANCLKECLKMTNEQLFDLLEKAVAQESKLKRDNNNATFDFIKGDTVLTIEHGVRKNRFIEIKFPGKEHCNCID